MITTRAYRKPTLWERIKQLFGAALPPETQPASGGTWKYVRYDDPAPAVDWLLMPRQVVIIDHVHFVHTGKWIAPGHGSWPAGNGLFYDEHGQEMELIARLPTGKWESTGNYNPWRAGKRFYINDVHLLYDGYGQEFAEVRDTCESSSLTKKMK